MNLQALAAMDDCEHATGKPLGRHMREVAVLHPRTAKEIVQQELAAYLLTGHHSGERGVFLPDRSRSATQMTNIILRALNEGGYSLVERVSVYK